MEDFGTAVSTLLESFSNGLAVIKRLKRKRKDKKTQIGASVKAEEERLSKSLQTNRKDIKSVYDRYAQANTFAAGDAESENSLTSILFRLNLGFVSIIDRFVKGESTHSDYRTLLNLSNASKAEAIQTFEQLQHRISQSTLFLEKKELPEHHKKKRKHDKRATQTSRSHTSSQSSDDSSKKASSTNHPKKTYLGPAIPEGWIRTKHVRMKVVNGSKKSTKPTSSSSKIPPPEPTPITQPQIFSPRLITKSPLLPTTQQQDSSLEYKPSQRFSIMSFATTSTRIGEIPEHKWAQTFSGTEGTQAYYARPVFPLKPYVEPEKQRSKLMKIFRKSG